MQFSLSLLTATFATLAMAAPHAAGPNAPDCPKYPAEPPASLRYGMLVFPAFQALDAFGPLDVLNTLAFEYKNNTIAIIAKTLDPVSTTAPRMNTTFAQSIVPTHTFDNAPELDVLIVPGGAGTRDPADVIGPQVEYIRRVFPNIKYLITVCTGAKLAADAGVLDGENATTNKNAYDWVISQPGSAKVNWIRKARWVEGATGKVWTTSGISAGIDGVFAWVGKVYGEEKATAIAKSLEYTRITDWQNDPFA